MTRSVGIVGTGMLGLAVALRLAKKGFDVTAYNRTPAKAEPVAAAGGRLAATPAEAAARSELVITVVRDARAVRDVSFGRDGILSGCGGHTTVADMSTIAPADSVLIHERFAQDGTEWLDTPVMGGPDAASEGRLVVMAGGSEKAFRGVEDAFAALAEERHYLGSAGAAHSVKLCMNLQIALLAISLSEGICLARGLGTSPDTFLKVLNSTYFGTGMSKRKAYRMIRDTYTPTFTLDNLAKDLETIRGAASRAGLTLDAASEALRMYQAARESGLGGLDYTGILEYVRRTGGQRAPDQGRPEP